VTLGAPTTDRDEADQKASEADVTLGAPMTDRDEADQKGS
jgi:hypothetical protein